MKHFQNMQISLAHFHAILSIPTFKILKLVSIVTSSMQVKTRRSNNKKPTFPLWPHLVYTSSFRLPA